MRYPHVLLPVLLAAVLPASAAGQSAAPWSLTVGLEGTRFGALAQDTTGTAAAAPDLRPTGRIGLRAVLRRTAGPWQLGMAIGWAGGNAEAANDVVAVRDLATGLDRYRGAILLMRRVSRVGGGELLVEVGPLLDIWVVDGETRTRGGAEGSLLLLVPLGPVSLEHRVVLGLSASPIAPADVGEDFELRPLRSVGFGLGVRVPL